MALPFLRIDFWMWGQVKRRVARGSGQRFIACAATLLAAASGHAAIDAATATVGATQSDRIDPGHAHCADPVVYIVLSPRMPYALKEWPRMLRSAQAAGFAAVSLRDARVDDDEWQAAVRAAGVPAALQLPRLQAPALIESFGPLNHFPTAVVQQGMRVHPWPILGVMPDAVFADLLEQRLKQLCDVSP